MSEKLDIIVVWMKHKVVKDLEMSEIEDLVVF